MVPFALPSATLIRSVNVRVFLPTLSGKETMDDRQIDEMEVDNLLQAVERGDPGSFDLLVQRIYPELKKLAHFHLSHERSSHTLNTTAIVHEAFIQLSSGARAWNGKSHFLRAASLVMRHVLVDYARRHKSEKRGAGMPALTLHEDQHDAQDDLAAVLALDSAIKEIGKIDSRLETIIECRYFAGLSVQQTAEILGVSNRTIEREWQRARGYLNAIMLSSDL